ncbi:MAG: hypothetical protein JSU87_12815 [Gemmatimonadota bacterium]|nr:MAG: hypothetical protein JSU87_12815 [Gemmatimonadota bacterium]
MSRRYSGFVLSGVLALTLGMATQQPSQPKRVTASVMVATSDSHSVVAVLSKDEPQFLFCIDLATPLPQKISYTGMARVVYEPLPPIPVVPGVKVDVKEDVRSALAVLPSGGDGWLFLAENESTVLSAGETAGVTTVPVIVVNRADWVPADGGPRRGLDQIEACFIAGG